MVCVCSVQCAHICTCVCVDQVCVCMCGVYVCLGICVHACVHVHMCVHVEFLCVYLDLIMPLDYLIYIITVEATTMQMLLIFCRGTVICITSKPCRVIMVINMFAQLFLLEE